VKPFDIATTIKDTPLADNEKQEKSVVKINLVAG